MRKNFKGLLRRLMIGSSVGLLATTLAAVPAFSQAPAPPQESKDAPKSATKDTKDAAKDAVKDTKDSAKDATKDTRDGAKNTAKDARDSAKDTTKDVRESAKDTAKDVRDSAKDTRDSAKDTAKDARDAARDTTKNARDATKDTRDSVRETTKDAARDSRDTVRDTSRDVRDAAKDTRDTVRGTARDVRDTVRDTAREVRGDRGGNNFRVEDTRSADLGLWFGRSTDRGLVISDVASRGAITKVGFREGDQILSVNGQRVTRERDFINYVFAEDVRRERVKVIVLRDSREETVYIEPNVFIEELQVVEHDPLEHFGVVLDDRYTDQIVVWKVIPRTPAYYSGIRAGDVLVSFRGERIASPTEFIRIVERTDPGLVAVEVNRDKRVRKLEVDVTRNDDRGESRTTLRPNLEEGVDRRTDRREDRREERREDRRDVTVPGGVQPGTPAPNVTPAPAPVPPTNVAPPTVTPPTTKQPADGKRPGLLPRPLDRK